MKFLGSYWITLREHPKQNQKQIQYPVIKKKKNPKHKRIQVANQDKCKKLVTVLSITVLQFEQKGTLSCNIYLRHFTVPGPNSSASHKDMPTGELVLDRMNGSKLWMYYGIPEEQLLTDWEADWDILVDHCPTSPCNGQLLQIKFFSVRS